MIGPVWQPVLPLIDAAAFNEKTNKISDQILDEEQKRVETFKNVLVTSLSEKLPATILTGSDFTSENAQKYKVENGLQIDTKNFPIVFFSEGDMNMVDFGKGKNVNEIFKNSEELKNSISKFATDLNLETVLISYNRLSVIGVGMFGITGNLRLESYLYLYKSNGDLLMDAYGWTKPTAIDGKELNQYQFQLDNFKELADLLSTELVNYIK
ncbi:MAG: hypothetical protein ABJG41_00860 [Cyclobacteriaceae bacterium]